MFSSYLYVFKCVFILFFYFYRLCKFSHSFDQQTKISPPNAVVVFQSLGFFIMLCYFPLISVLYFYILSILSYKILYLLNQKKNGALFVEEYAI